LFSASLRKYHEINGQLPDKIIIYRDGVGDGQLQAVIEHEVSQLIQCFKTIQDGAEYK
jgi:aubergine-like protein